MNRYISLFFLIFFLATTNSYSQTCQFPVRLAEDSSDHLTIQSAYDFASIDLALNDFTLMLAGETFNEDLILDSGSIRLDGGYDCSFSSKVSSTGILGSITISGAGAVTVSNIGIISPPPCAFDNDNDGFTSIGSCTGSADDCNDNNPNVYPGAAEICDGADNNCNGQVDEGLTAVDADNDGYFAPGSCGGSAEDCNDSNPGINPGAIEIYNDGIDQNCDGKDLSNSSDAICAGCHDSAWIDTGHRFDMSPDGTCVICHAIAVSSILDWHYGLTVKTAGNNMDAGAIIGCVSCHDETHEIYTHSGASVVIPKVWAVWPNETCDTCHENRAALHAGSHSVEVGPDDLSYNPPGTPCSSCHVVANWSEIEGVEHNVPTNGDGSCATCHNSPRTEARITISSGIPPIHCLDCHSDKDLTPHGSVDHGAAGYVTGGSTTCLNCHDPGGAANGTVDVIHNGNCSHCHTTVPSLQPGVPAGGGDCTTCHGSDFITIHPVTIDHSQMVAAYSTCTLNCHTATADTGSGLPLDGANNKVHDGCTTCHNSDGSLVVPTTIARAMPDGGTAGGTDGGGDCTACHYNIAAPDTSTYFVVHANIGGGGWHQNYVQITTDGTCELCHVPPAPDADLATAGGELFHNAACGSCHTITPGLNLTGELKAGPRGIGTTLAGTGDCKTCHNPATYNTVAIHHNSYHNYAPTGQCQHCHDNGAGKMAADHTALVSDATASCDSCHSANIGDTTGAPVDSVNDRIHDACVTCHNTDGTLKIQYGNTIAMPDGGPGTDNGGGDCTVCHGGYFPNHTHHNGISNEVSYDPSSDTSQSSPTGCAACHHDYDNLHGTSVGLGTWDTILVEHDLDGTKDGSTNTCHNCHAYDGSGTAPLQDVQNAIGSGSPATCATCHTDKVPDVDHGVPTNGKHTEHLENNGDCSTCHGSIPLLNDGLNLSGTNTCYTCHQDGAGNPVTADIKAGWTDPGFTVSCGDCHGVPPTTGSHDTHPALDGCSSCHNPDEHLTGYIDVYTTSPGDLGYPSLKEIGTPYATCSTTYCHNIGAPQWGGTVACGDCHAVNGSLAGMHASHYDSQDNATGMLAANNSTADNYIFTCGVCHDTAHPDYMGHVTGPVNADPANNQVAEVYFDTTVAGGPVGGIGWWTGATYGVDPVGFAWTDQECGNMYCHSPGNKNAAPYDGAPATPNWVSGFSGECRECHRGDANTSTPMVTGSHYQHIYGDEAEPMAPRNKIECNRCHAETVADSRTVADKSKHVNREVNVAFDETADPAGTGSYAGAAAGPMVKTPGTAFGDCSNTYCHSQGTTVNAPYPAPNYAGALTWGMDATNFGHPDNPTEHCSACHGSYDDIGFGGIDTNAHQAHVAYANADKIGDTIGCSNCHRATTSGGMDLDTPENHTDGFVEIKFEKDLFDYRGVNFDTDGPDGTGPTYAGQNTAGDDLFNDFARVVPDTSTKYSCSNVYCHSNGNLAANVNNVDPTSYWGEGQLADPATAFKTIEWNSTTHISCDGCHGDGAGRAHPTYANGGPATTTANSHVAHVEDAGLNCTFCHQNTLSDTNIPPTGGLLDLWPDIHINRLENVSIKSLAGTTPDAYEAEAVKGCTAVYCHSNGSAVVTGIVSQTPSIIIWGGAGMTCNSCHNTDGGSNNGPDYANGTPKANSHASHQIFGCNTCHYSTTSNGSTITNIANHVNQTYDVQAGGGVTFTYTFGSNGGTCASISCHGGSGAVWGASPDHAGIITVGSTVCADCHFDPPPLIDANDPQVHNSCGSCHDANGALISLAAEKSAPGDCATCHGSDVQTVHTSCTTCHGEPPNGTVSPNTEGAHDAHAGLGLGSVSPSCNACHDGAAHYNGTTEVSVLSGFDDQSSGTPTFNGDNTCSNTRCHGGQTTPNWLTGTIDVNTDCESCHKRQTYSTPDEYNDFYSGRHRDHTNRSSINCWDCHSISKLATGHFSNLQSSTFEQDPGTTIGGSDTKIGSYNNSYNTCSNIQCHGSETW